MFNDVLSRETCEELLLRLAKTDFPFVCAHGRPSMAPVVNLSRPEKPPSRRPLSWKGLDGISKNG